MRINHNIQALNAYRNLYQNQFQTSKNLERLSSGLRINRAADDAAGLAISEKMRSQIRGLKQAERNSLDGVSLMQVAEGAMTEVHSMLQRMRELAVQAANDTNTTSDRNSIQLEIDQLLKEIDSIAAKTEFNTRKLLDGSSAVDTQYLSGQMAMTNIKDVPTVTDPSLPTGKYEFQISGVTSVYTINQPGAGISDNTVLSIASNQGLPYGEYSIVVSNFQEENGQKNATIEVFDPDGFSVGQLAAKVGASGTTETIGTSPRQISIDTAKIAGDGTAKIQVEGKMNVSVSRVENGTPTPITFTKEITTQNGVLTHGGLEMKFGTDAKNGTSQFDLTNKALAFQIGANTNQGLQIDVPQLSTVKLGINNISVLSHKDANDAIFKLEKAINQISSTRAKLGATQNRLEHTINNLQTTHENLTASESRIRDADMALEMTEFTKNNILNQSAQAMLAQANQLPQGVLQLLQG
ncbi:flagellin [Cytobacillus firmus]|uniref:flagellin N-terminal helical domain-containing protein n=1 Tax=Cytobacillus firmus TaxID=1399 RepID=UPI0021844656|nr:flagellin [Cytobacillus firmus]URM33447.1 flagellin [Cytobacillus firmus]